MNGSGRFLPDARLRTAAAGAVLWLCAAMAPAAEPGTQRQYEGACSMTAASGETVFAGSCTITRDRVTKPGGAGAGCSYARFEVLFPDIGLGVVLQGDTEDCPSRFQGGPADFVARDKTGRLVVATSEGALLRFDPGPPEAEPAKPLPPLDDFLSGIEACTYSNAYAAFVSSLLQAYPVTASDPDGPTPGPAPAATILWPPGNPPAGIRVQARKLGGLQQIDVALRGSYFGIPVAGLRIEAPIGADIRSDLFLFDAPRSDVEQKFGASVRGKRNRAMLKTISATVLPDLPAGEPGSLRCARSE